MPKKRKNINKENKRKVKSVVTRWKKKAKQNIKRNLYQKINYRLKIVML